MIPKAQTKLKSLRTHTVKTHAKTHTAPFSKQGQDITGVLPSVLRHPALNKRFDHWQWIQTGHANSDFIFKSSPFKNLLLIATGTFSSSLPSLPLASSLGSRGAVTESLQGFKGTQQDLFVKWFGNTALWGPKIKNIGEGKYNTSGEK